MAIKCRRGEYKDFDKTQLVEGEPAIVLSGDPTAADGKAFYACFGVNDVKRMATLEDMENDIDAVNQQIMEDFTAGVNQATTNANNAADRANTISETLETKLENGDFVGPQGPQGIQGAQGEEGPQGPQGPKGDSGQANFKYFGAHQRHTVTQHDEWETLPSLTEALTGELHNPYTLVCFQANFIASGTTYNCYGYPFITGDNILTKKTFTWRVTPASGNTPDIQRNISLEFNVDGTVRVMCFYSDTPSEFTDQLVLAVTVCAPIAEESTAEQAAVMTLSLDTEDAFSDAEQKGAAI